MKKNNTADGISFETRRRFAGAMKFPAALCGTLGITVIVAESVCRDFPFLLILLLSLFWCGVFYLLLRPKKGTVAGAVMLVSGLAVFSAVLFAGRVGQGALRFLASGIASVWNLFMETIDSLGYVTLPLETSKKFVYSEFAAMYFVSFLSAAVFCLFTRKKTRLFAVSVFTALVLTPVFIYNMPGGNAGISLIIASLAALAAMRISEKRTGDVRMSGYPGVAALLASSIMLAVPAASMNAPWKNEGGLADSIEYLREIVTRLAEGDTSILDGAYPSDYLNNRSAAAGRHHYTGREIMKVYSGTDSALYLRTWIGGYFNGTSWEVPRTGLSGGITAEERTWAFASDMFGNGHGDGSPALSSVGMIRCEVSVVPKLRTKYIPVPSVMLLGPFDMNGNLFPLEYSRVGDGILMTKKDLSSRTPFKADVLITTPRSSAERDLFHRVLEEYRGSIGDCGLVDEPVLEDTLSAFVRQQYCQNDIPQAADSILEDFLDTSEVAQRYFGLFYESEKVRDPESSDIVGWFIGTIGTRRIFRYYGTADSVAADDIATALSVYLAENYRYNIDPPSPTTGDPVAEFLLVSKEGYCVQFATALTLMMRRLGFPARYVEGYIANEFKAAKGDYPYSCTVTDKKAHAWTEVWLDGFGWMVYEATPGFSYRGQNIGNAGSTAPDTTQPPQTSTPPASSESDDRTRPPQPSATVDRTTDPPVTSDPGRSQPSGKNVGGILTAVLAAAALAVAVLMLAKRSSARTGKRKKLISDALDGKGDGKLLCLLIFRMLGVYGICPGRNELPSAFEARAAEMLGDTARHALSAAERQIYGSGMTEADKRAAGVLLRYLSDGAKEKLGFFRFVWYRYIVCVI